MSPRSDSPLFPLPVSASVSLSCPLSPLFLPVTLSPLHATGTKPTPASAWETVDLRKCSGSFVHADMDTVAPPYESLEALERSHFKMLTRDRLTKPQSKPLNIMSKVAKLIQASSSCSFYSAGYLAPQVKLG